MALQRLRRGQILGIAQPCDFARSYGFALPYGHAQPSGPGEPELWTRLPIDARRLILENFTLQELARAACVAREFAAFYKEKLPVRQEELETSLLAFDGVPGGRWRLRECAIEAVDGFLTVEDVLAGPAYQESLWPVNTMQSEHVLALGEENIPQVKLQQYSLGVYLLCLYTLYTLSTVGPLYRSYRYGAAHPLAVLQFFGAVFSPWHLLRYTMGFHAPHPAFSLSLIDMAPWLVCYILGLDNIRARTRAGCFLGLIWLAVLTSLASYYGVRRLMGWKPWVRRSVTVQGEGIQFTLEAAWSHDPISLRWRLRTCTATLYAALHSDALWTLGLLMRASGIMGNLHAGGGASASSSSSSGVVEESPSSSSGNLGESRSADQSSGGAGGGLDPSGTAGSGLARGAMGLEQLPIASGDREGVVTKLHWAGSRDPFMRVLYRICGWVSQRCRMAVRWAGWGDSRYCPIRAAPLVDQEPLHAVLPLWPLQGFWQAGCLELWVFVFCVLQALLVRLMYVENDPEVSIVA